MINEPTISFHNTVKITLGEPRNVAGMTNYRSLFVYSENGSKHEIEFFSKKIKSLLVKEEKE